MTGLQAIANCCRRSFGDFTELALRDQNEAGPEGIEPPPTVLETAILPLNQEPVYGRYRTTGRRIGYRWTEGLISPQRLNIQLHAIEESNLPVRIGVLDRGLPAVGAAGSDPATLVQQDSNPHFQSQNLTCYRYTMDQ